MGIQGIPRPAPLCQRQAPAGCHPGVCSLPSVFGLSLPPWESLPAAPTPLHSLTASGAARCPHPLRDLAASGGERACHAHPAEEKTEAQGLE